jgi:hypothetical protein
VGSGELVVALRWGRTARTAQQRLLGHVTSGVLALGMQDSHAKLAICVDLYNRNQNKNNKKTTTTTIN